MLNPLASLELFHLHQGRRVRMERREHHDPADHDLERALARGAQLFSCPECDDLDVADREGSAPSGEQGGREG